MMDFRYHVISLVAVFFALAVGIVLGSGPMRTALVGELTDERAQLQEELADAQVSILREQQKAGIGEQFVDQAEDALIGDALVGQRVAIILVQAPGAVPMGEIRDRVVAAGATVTATITILDTWMDPEFTSFRTAFAAQIADNVVGVDSTVSADRLLAHALAQALVPTAAPDIEDPTDVTTNFPDSSTAADRAEVLLDLLKQAELATGTISGEVDLILFVVGAGPDDEDVLVSQSGVIAQIAGISHEYVDGVVVASGPDREGDIAQVIQSSALLSKTVTTVTYAMNIYGSFTVAKALEIEAVGDARHFGYGEDGILYPSS